MVTFRCYNFFLNNIINVYINAPKVLTVFKPLINVPLSEAQLSSFLAKESMDEYKGILVQINANAWVI